MKLKLQVWKNLVKLIAIVDARFGVAKQCEIPWQFKDDLLFFQKQTINQVILMGRQTLFSLPHVPLKDRTNCVVSKTMKATDWSENGIEIFESLESAIDRHADLWIIGGAKLYNYALEKQLVEYAIITQVHRDYDADLFIKSSLLENFTRRELFSQKDYTVVHFRR